MVRWFFRLFIRRRPVTGLATHILNVTPHRRITKT